MERPTFEEELILWQQGYGFVVGLDEVGRGAFAGPVTVAAVVFPNGAVREQNVTLLSEINDSKLLSPQKREVLSEFIRNTAMRYAIACVPVTVINRVGIGKATEKAFRNVLQKLFVAIDHTSAFLLIDGFHIKYVRNFGLKKQKAILKGDRKSISIAAASIIAKVHRDNLMRKYHPMYEAYNFFSNKGYGTQFHQRAIKEYGLCPLHRTSFKLQT